MECRNDATLSHCGRSAELRTVGLWQVAVGLFAAMCSAHRPAAETFNGGCTVAKKKAAKKAKKPAKKKAKKK
jgi:hypothetical protein